MADTVLRSSEQYKARFATYVAGKDVLEMQSQAPRTLARLIANVPEERLKAKPAPGKWSVTEIIAHMAEDELISSWRYRQMIEHSTPELRDFDQDLWATLGDYAAWKSGEALEMFRLLREANLRMFAKLTPEQWDRTGIHAERGKITVRGQCTHMAAHDINHIEQVQRVLGS